MNTHQSIRLAIGDDHLFLAEVAAGWIVASYGDIDATCDNGALHLASPFRTADSLRVIGKAALATERLRARHEVARTALMDQLLS